MTKFEKKKEINVAVSGVPEGIVVAVCCCYTEVLLLFVRLLHIPEYDVGTLCQLHIP